MRGFHFYHAHKIGHHLSDFWMYELSVWLHTLARSLVAIFIPILMLKSGFDIKSVVLYYLMYNIFDVPLNFVARHFVRRFGARFTIAIATIVTIVFFWLFIGLDSVNMQILLLLALLSAVYDSFYWVAHFYLFVESSGSSKHAGKSTGTMHAVRQVAIKLGPLIGAATLIFLSRDALLYMTIAGFLLSLLPLMHLGRLPDKPRGKGVPFWKFFSFSESKRIYTSLALFAVHDVVETVLFPVFIFITFGTIESVAVIPILLSVSAMVIAVFSGRISRKYWGAMIVLGAAAVAAMWLARIFIGNPTMYYTTVLAISICIFFVMVPLDSLLFTYGRRVGDTLSASMYRNVVFMGSNIILFSILAAFLEIFEVSFALAATSLIALVVVNALGWIFVRRA